MKFFNSRFRYLADSFQRLYCLSVEQRYGKFPFLQKFSRECWLVMGLCPLIPLCFFRGMPKGWASLAARVFFTGAWRPVPLCYFSLLRQRKVTKRKASPARTAVLSGRHKVAAWAQGRPAPCALGPRHGITAGLCPSERESCAAVGASGGWVSAGALRCRTGGRLRRFLFV